MPAAGATETTSDVLSQAPRPKESWYPSRLIDRPPATSMSQPSGAVLGARRETFAAIRFERRAAATALRACEGAT